MSTLTFLFSLLAATGDGDGRTPIVIMLGATEGLPPVVAELDTEMADELHQTGQLAPITTSEVKSLITFEQHKQLLGCEEAGCYTELGSLLKAPYLIQASASATGEGGAPRLSLRLVDVAKGEIVARQLRDLPRDFASMRAAARGAAAVLVRPLLQLNQGELVLVINEEEAKVEVDERLVGLAPVPRLTLAGGRHQVHVELEGFHPVVRDVEVVPDQVQVEHANLIPSQAFIEAYAFDANLKTYGGLAMAAAGIALVATGAILYAVQQGEAATLQSDVIDFNASGRTDAAARAALEDRRNDLQTRGYLWSGMAIFGAGLSVSGLVLWLLAPDANRYDAYAGAAP